MNILTLSSFALKIDNSAFDQENFKTIVSFFTDFLNDSINESLPNWRIDLLLRRFLQFLYFTLAKNIDFGLDVEVWEKILNLISTEKTWQHIFLPLSRYLNKIEKIDGELIEDYRVRKDFKEQPFCQFILDAQFEKGDDIYVCFCKSKRWAAIYVSFYFQKAIKTNNQEIISKYIKNVVDLLKEYFQNHKRKNIGDIINKSEFFKVFDYPKIYSERMKELYELVQIQIQSNSHEKDFLFSYFSKVKDINTWWESIKISKQTIFELVLLTYVSVEFYEKFKEIAVDFVYTFFEKVYEDISIFRSRYNKIMWIFSLSFRFLPPFWDHFSEFLKFNTKNVRGRFKPIAYNDYEDKLDKASFLQKLVKTHKNDSSSKAPQYFIDFTDYLIKYLKSSKIDDLYQMQRLFSNELNGFSLHNVDYSDPYYCAKILMEICWNSEFISKKRTENKERLEIEEKKAVSNTEDIIQLPESQNSANESSQYGTEEEKKEFNVTKNTRNKFLISTADNPETPRTPRRDIEIVFIIKLLEEFKDSYIMNMLFENVIFKPQVQKWLLSQLKNLFSLKISIKDSPKVINFMAETNSFVLKLISNPIIVPDQTQLDIFKELAESRVVKEGFNEIDLEFTPSKPYYNQVYFASLPGDLAGVTIFGGDILINSKYDNSEELNLCVQKITFVHELAHYVRKTNEGYYDISKKTPISQKKLYKGVPGRPKNKLLIRQDEGGAMLEAAIFCLFVSGVSESQIKFLNSISNWNLPLENFKEKLEKLYAKNQAIYNLGRCHSKLYYFNRELHNH